MSIASFEQEIVNVAKQETHDNSLTRKRLFAWYTGRADVCPITNTQEGDQVVYLPSLQVWAGFEAKRPKKSAS